MVAEFCDVLITQDTSSGSGPRRRDAELRPLITEGFGRRRQTYGPLRVRADLLELGQRLGKNWIARLMGEEG